jgi:hypothetical protein
MGFALLSRYGYSDVRIVVTVSPVSLAHDGFDGGRGCR